MARFSGKILGYCAYLARGRLYHTTLTNLSLCFPGLSARARRQLLKQSLINTGMTVAEGGAVWLWPAQKILGRITEVEGKDLLLAKLEAGKGLILVGPHHGNWELMGLYLGTLGNCSQLFLESRDKGLGELMYLARSRSRARLYPANNKGVAAALNALKQGEMTGIMPDQVPVSKAGVFAPFFGQQAYTMTLIPRLLQKTGAAALLCYAKRTDHGFRVVIKEPGVDIYAEHMPTAVAGLNRTVEMAVLDAPEQYQWEYKRFRYQPDGMAEPYIR